MDSNSDDRDPEVPPDVSPDELQEALRWLDEMAGRPGVGPEVSEAATEFPFQGLIEGEEDDLPDWLRETSPAPVDSPLTDDGEFESRLDWLAKMAERESIEELPTLEWRQLTDAALPADNEAGPDAQDTLPPTLVAEELPIEATPVEPLRAEFVVHPPPLPAIEPEAEAEQPVEPEEAMPAPQEETVEAVPDLSATAPITAEALLDTLPPDEELPPINDLDAAMAWIEELAASQDAPVEDVPSVADRALTSKLLMEAGLSPDELGLRPPGNELALGDLSLLEGSTPINAFVAEEDFADTIVLVETMAAEQGQPLVIPPSEPEFVPAVPIADEVSFDDAMAFLDELAAQESFGAVTQPIQPVETEIVDVAVVSVGLAAVAEDSFMPTPVEELDAAAAESGPPDEALSADDVPEPTEIATMADELAELGAASVEAVDEPFEVSADSDVVVIEEVNWHDDSDAALVEPSTPDDRAVEEPLELSAAEAGEQGEFGNVNVASGGEMDASFLPSEAAAESIVAVNGDRAADLEQWLRVVDALALPAGVSLAELDLSLRRSGAMPVRRDLPAAVEWLEVALGISVPTPPLTPTDEDLVARMPDDPDAVLAWLEQMAEEDTIDSSAQLALADKAAPSAAFALPGADSTPARSGQTAESPIDEFSEADLLSMPEDPDAVMAWLEGLASGAPPARREPVDEIETQPAETTMPPSAPPILEPAPELRPTKARSRRRRGRKPALPAGESIPNEAAESAEPVVDDVARAVPDAAIEEAEGLVVEVVEMPETVVGPAVEEGGLLVWPTADDAVEVELAPAEPIEAPPTPPPAPPTLAARPRRRGRKPKGETDTSIESPLLIVEVAAEPGDESAAGAADATDTTPPPPEATPPAKPASWVDLLKPLR